MAEISVSEQFVKHFLFFADGCKRCVRVAGDEKDDTEAIKASGMHASGGADNCGIDSEAVRSLPVCGGR